jgi:glycosyltransferase involved in cell wall biosynthesis
LTLVEEGGYRKSNPFIMLLSLIEKYGYSKADVIVGTMPNLAEHVKHVVKTEKRVECIPFGLDDQTILSSPSDVIQTSLINTYIPRDKFVVCYAGSIGLTNALETLFKCAELMKQDKDVHFIIIGDGDLKSQYERQFGHLKNVSFFPQIEKYMLQSILVACDLLYFATKNSLVWRYGQSLNKIIDYMLAGRPIIGSYSGYPSMINEADCGSFVPAENEVALMKEIIRYKIMPKEERDRIGKRGQNWLLKNREYQYLAEKYIEIING